MLGSIEPNFGTRTWHNIFAEGTNALVKVLNKYPNDQVIVNLVGFSRGGISVLQVAQQAATYSGVKKINILNFDPVPGGLDPVYTHGTNFILDPKVNQYVGVYAEDERSYPFEAVVPTKTVGSATKVLVVRTPGSHETMVGNRQIYGHSIGLSGLISTDVNDYNLVFKMSQVIAEQLLTSSEWGQVPLSTLDDANGIYSKHEFTSLASQMWDVFLRPGPWPHANHHVAIQQTSFLGLFGGRDIFYSPLGLGHELRVPAPISVEKRLVFLGDKRRPFGQWVRSYLFFGMFVFNSEVVYWLEDIAPRIDASTWDTLQSFRGGAPIDDEAPVPNTTSLPKVEGQCAVFLSEPPKATDNIDGLIDGTTTDPLNYLEQGVFWLEWRYTDLAGNTTQQQQDIVVDDTLPPIPVQDTLPLVQGECNTTITTIPLGYDNCEEEITAYTSDPLTYSAQGQFGVNWIYQDANNNRSTQIQSVMIKDVTAPVISGITATQDTLWPSHHRMSLVTLDISVTDNCDAEPICSITSVTSNEKKRHSTSFNRRNSDKKNTYWEIVGDNAVLLRANSARKRGASQYTITSECVDAVGNSSAGETVVSVRKDQGNWNRKKDKRHRKERR